MSATEKERLRRQVLAKRDAMDEAERQHRSQRLLEFADDLQIVSAQIVSGFFPIRSEIDVRPLMGALAEEGATICLPVVMDKETIVFRQYDEREELVKTGFGTFGPGPDAAVLDPDVMLIPLAGFDFDGNRIGYGAGYYDRAIARLHAKGKKPKLIGAAFECQKVEAVPYEPHDVPLDAILTENGLHMVASRP